MDFSIEVLFLDLMKAAVLIFLGHMLRSKVKFLQNLYIPSSLIAGFIGLAIGPYGINIMRFSSHMGNYTSAFMVIVFSAIAYGSFSVVKEEKRLGELKESKGESLKRILALYIYRSIASILVYIVPIGVGVYIIDKFIMKLPEGFTILVGGGFVGGHGTNAAFGSAVTEATGWAGATDVGMTFATVGVLVGLIGGIIMIKNATNKKYTSFVNRFDALPEQFKTGWMPEKNEPEMGREMVSPIALDPLAWSFLMIIIPTGLAYATIKYIRIYLSTMPTYLWAFLIAVAMTQLLKYSGIGKHVDKRSISRISGSATDFLVFFGVAGIKIEIVMQFAMPIIVLSAMALGSLLLCMYVVGPRLNNKYWFERCIFVYGYCTGVYAIGLTLLRICDPEGKSKTLEDAAVTSPIDFVEYYTLLLGPILLSTGRVNTFMTVMCITLVASFAAAFILKLWNPIHKERLSDGELEI